MHVSSESSILYFGTPVILVSTINEDGSFNLAPISSIFWLGWRAMIGVGSTSQTARNLKRSGVCVLNLASVNEAEAVNRLALTTGSDAMSAWKAARGYRLERNKFALAGLTPQASETVAAPRVQECLVQQEASVAAMHGIAEDEAMLRGGILTFELRIQRLYLDASILLDGNPDRVDPDKWQPLIMSFQKFYGLDNQQLHPSTLAGIPEKAYRSPDIDKARQIPAIA
ncbi:flavin reductase family protein [Undibacterium sp. CY18W]|uniref:Flavin reductase family protein n=1 Tax=Undibacterium hunanense TaxID=2762292 RepID=A0ABR6ZXI2_9BURK|nr:flavin reductase family protein [Undibacterium hunanense]MBC3920572.1 flavin reductase family protein [Undibacterium hunanense]